MKKGGSLELKKCVKNQARK